MSIQDIADAAEAQNTLTDRINTFMDGLEDDKAAYAALSGDLVGEMINRMNFTATWNSGEANPDNVRLGTFSSLATLVQSAPRGADITVQVPAGATVHLTESVLIYNQRLSFVKQGAGGDPRIVFDAYDNGAFNYRYNIRNNYGGGMLSFTNCIVDLADKSDPNLGWGLSEMFTPFQNGNNPTFVRFQNCTVISAGASNLFRLTYGGSVFLHAAYTTFDGPITCLPLAAHNLIFISRFSVTMQNGAVLYSGGTVGQNILLV